MVDEGKSGVSKIPSGLAKSAKLRTDRVGKKLDAAYRTIEAEIEKNEGLYPLNGGRLPEAEVFRRAGVSAVTLLHPRHATVRKNFKEWHARVVSKMITGSPSVRREVTKRVDTWKTAYLEIANKFHLFKLEQVAKEEELEAKARRIAELERAVQELQAELSKGKVTPLRGSRKREAPVL